MDKVLTLQSHVKPKFMHKALIRAIILTLLGALGIILGYMQMDQDDFAQWGFFLFIAGFAIAGIGLTPWLYFKWLSSKPSEIKIFGHHYLEFFSKNQKKLTIPFSQIENIVYIDRNDYYGIGIQLVPAYRNQLIAKFHLMEHDPLQRRWQDEFEADAFFAYFDRDAFERLETWRQS